MKYSAFKSALIISTLSGPGDALAGERAAWRDDPLDNRIVLGVGLFRPRLDTKVRRESVTGA